MSKKEDNTINFFENLKAFFKNKKEGLNFNPSSFDENIDEIHIEESKKKKPAKNKKTDIKEKGKNSNISDVESPINSKNKKNLKTSKSVKVFLAVGKVILALLCGVLIGTSGFIAYAFLISPLTVFEASGFKESDPAAIVRYDELDIADSVQVDELDLLLSAADYEMMDGIVNVAIIGVDYEPIRESSEWKTKDKQFFADVMLVLAINFNDKTVDMINIPRDSYWGIYKTPGFYKLNMSFYAGGEFEGDGFNYTRKSMESVLGGIPIDYYIGVTMPVVKEIVDILGGVEFEIEDKIKMGDRFISPGMQHLDGQQTLDFLRARSKSNPKLGNDISRVDRQKELLIALFSQAKKSNKLLSIPKIIGAMEGRIFTNMTYQQLSSLVIFGAGLKNKNIDMHTFKGRYDYTMSNHHLYMLDAGKRIELIKSIYGIKVVASNKYDLKNFRKDTLIVKSKKLAYYAQKRANDGVYGSAGTQILKASSSLKTAIKDGKISTIESRYSALASLVGDTINLYFSDFNKDGMPYHG